MKLLRINQITDKLVPIHSTSFTFTFAFYSIIFSLNNADITKLHPSHTTHAKNSKCNCKSGNRTETRQ